MPSTSKKQHNFMEAVAHNKGFAKKVGVSQSVGKDFSTADKGKKFKNGGETMKSDSKEDMKMDKAQDKKIIKKAFSMHDKQEHKGGKGTNLAALKKGGKVVKMAAGGMPPDPRMMAMMAKKKGARRPMAGPAPTMMPPAQGMPMKKGGAVKKMAGGGAVDGIASRGKTKGTMIKMAGGGSKKYC
jgi:hypothetical protein